MNDLAAGGLARAAGVTGRVESVRAWAAGLRRVARYLTCTWERSDDLVE